MPLPWIKMWLEALDDSKLTRLSLAERGAWWGLLELAGKCGASGKIVSGGEGLGMEEIADALHIKTSEDRKALESMIAKMEQRGSLIWNGTHVLTVVHWEERQRIPPSALPEAVAERVRRYRERRKKTGNGKGAQPSPEAGRDKGVQPKTSQDDAVLAVWSGVKNFPRDSEGATRFLTELRAEFPDIDILRETKKWAAAKLSKPLTKRSMPFKQLLAWMLQAREYAQERRQGEQDRGQRIKVTRPPSEFSGDRPWFGGRKG